LCVVLKEHRSGNLCDLSLRHFLRLILLRNCLRLFRLILRSMGKETDRINERIGRRAVPKVSYILGSFAEIIFFATANFLVCFCFPIALYSMYNKVKDRKNTEGSASVVCVSTFHVRSANCWTVARSTVRTVRIANVASYDTLRTLRCLRIILNARLRGINEHE
jgi:hypothetical protein